MPDSALTAARPASATAPAPPAAAALGTPTPLGTAAAPAESLATGVNGRTIGAVEVRLVGLVKPSGFLLVEIPALDQDRALVRCWLALVEFMTRPSGRGRRGSRHWSGRVLLA